MSLNQR